DYRYTPDPDAAPFMQEFQVDTGGKDLMVLDVLALIKEQDEGFSYRRSCREGVCGSDGMNINGKNGLACVTPLSAVVKGNKLIVRPLPGLPVIRDLVVDMSIFYKQYEKVKPFLQNDTPAPAIERLASLDDPFSVFRCRGIMNCVSVCPKGLNPTKAIGHIRNMLLQNGV
ncbi:2Fe-2S iron-sulfur cluster-binding protein, partial [Pseudomonas sp. NPDC087697]|uniref:2Fe-2S iron-sulfur cluster-binding protein n=1 Tax=Pseudomonas sp. NPDC087697 TaxID=3364447 RepID=UPI0037F5DFE4